MSMENQTGASTLEDVKDAETATPTTPNTPETPSKAGSVAEMVEEPELLSKERATPDVSPEFLPTLTNKYRLKANIQFFAACWSLFLAGWNDGTNGPLLPRIREVYHVSYAVVSLIFVFSCIGFVSGATANVWLTDRFGLGKVMVLGAMCQVVGYALESPAPPFEVLVLGYLINGFGLALQDAGANSYVASLKEGASTKMSLLHAVYGLGALCSPLVATQFAQLPRWSFHYLTSLGVALSNVVLLSLVFRFKTQDQCLAEIGQEPVVHPEDSLDNSKYKQMFNLKELHLLAFFIFIYVGVEVTVGGWIVTYVIDVRDGGPSSGYISAGFFGGLTLGRVALLWVNKTVGERYVIFLYVALAIGLELVVWLVSSLIAGAVAVSFVGMMLGPIYPIVMNHSGRILPPWLLNACIGWIAGIGQPLLVAMMGFLFFLWLLVPNSNRRADEAAKEAKETSAEP
ncbi:hypothetical protein EUX98_g1406 [Antrodiella citrinella]|uniref:Major facilitator superfamily (MFS) profile domain-containing protein n=1 Tax=Antrodiella citrinella TaxID=2447956 RepID=A0A4S4N1I8_9APHY|nr:hypothetical protein EUX98_g1406 [Antrodiella citrinella]